VEAGGRRCVCIGGNEKMRSQLYLLLIVRNLRGEDSSTLWMSSITKRTCISLNIVKEFQNYITLLDYPRLPR
jgi:hypothetical protein